MTIKRGNNMANLSIHKIFMDNVQTIKNIQISNGEFHPDNKIYGKNIGTNEALGTTTISIKLIYKNQHSPCQSIPPQ